MSIHSTLKIAAKGAQQRSVLTRIERIKNLMEKGLWSEGENVTGLPKLKILRVKFKKEKAAEKPAAEGQAAATGAAAQASAAPAAPGAEPKTAKAKEKAK